MNRRGVLTGLATTCGLFSIARPAFALSECSAFSPTGWQRCSASVSSRLIALQAIGTVDPQLQSQWCWAASIASIFAYYGHPVSQARIVADTWGDIVDMPGTNAQIVANLNRPWTDDNGAPFRVFGETFSANPITAAQDLASDQPLIIGTRGHAMVLSELVYDRHISGQGQVVAASVMDPWPYNHRFRALNAEEWFGVYLCVRIRVMG